ncbi:Muconate cycloisomerase 1 [Metarhizium anisopliae]
MELFVGTFNVPYIYTLSFDPLLAHLNVTHVSHATAPHAWISFAPNQKTLYAAAWDPPSVAAYKSQLDGPFHTLEPINTKPVANSPGYVVASDSHLYSAGGATGEAFHLDSDGALGDLAQQLEFATGTPGGVDGLRSGAHSADLSPDGRTLYVADIGSNAVWTFSVSQQATGSSALLTEQQKNKAAREEDGPRHAWPHPNGQILYVIQEHSNMVDVFQVNRRQDGTVQDLEHLQGASVLPPGKNASDYAADEVRFSTGPPGHAPRYLFASTRGSDASRNGYVSAFELDSQGRLVRTEATDLWETPTSGGGSNAVEPAPWVAETSSDVQYLALTDAAAGKVYILGFDGACIYEVSEVALEIPASDGDKFNGTVQAATAVWLAPARELIE